MIQRGLPKGGAMASLIERLRRIEAQREAGTDGTPPWEPDIVAAVERDPFPTQYLPEPVRSLVRCGARALVCDPSYIALPALAVTAGCVGATRRVRLMEEWAEPAVLWCAVVGESGTKKSPAQELVTEALWRREREWYAKFCKEQRDFEEKVARAKQRPKDAHNPSERLVPPTCRRVLLDDLTIEALCARLAENPRGLIVARDELGAWLASFDAYRAGRGGDLQRWLSIHGARNVSVDRVSRRVLVPRAAVSICGGIQPDILRRALRSEHFESGLVARFLFASPPPQPKVWSDAPIPSDVKRQFAAVLDSLLSLEFGHDDEGNEAPVDLPLDGKAYRLFVDWYNRHAQEEADMTGHLRAAWAKLEGAAGRLALVHHLILAATGHAPEDVIGAASVEAGCALADWFGKECKRLYGQFDETDEDRDRRKLLDWLQGRGGKATVREVQRNCRWLKEPGAAEVALDDLRKAGLGEWKATVPTEKGGRPGRVFCLSTCRHVDETSKNPGKSEVLSTVDRVTPAQRDPQQPPGRGVASAEREAAPGLAQTVDINAALQEAATETWGGV